jgi:hypothetical protein
MSVRLFRLEEKTSKAGNDYITGTIGDLRVHGFKSKTEPGVWNFFLRHERKPKAAKEAPSTEDDGGGE